MKKFTLALIGIVAVLGGVGVKAWLVQREETTRLQVELAALRFELRERGSLRDENTRLRGLQISPAELEALRADHAALPRLRAELEALSKSTPNVAR